MCLAVPAQVVEVAGEQATVDLQGSRLCVHIVLTPDVRPGDWVLVHAGFSIATVDERDALETWDYLRAIDAPVGPEPAAATERGARRAPNDRTTA